MSIQMYIWMINIYLINVSTKNSWSSLILIIKKKQKETIETSLNSRVWRIHQSGIKVNIIVTTINVKCFPNEIKTQVHAFYLSMLFDSCQPFKKIVGW